VGVLFWLVLVDFLPFLWGVLRTCTRPRVRAWAIARAPGRACLRASAPA